MSRPLSLPPNTRDSLYQGLPTGVKASLRSKLQSFEAKEEVYNQQFLLYYTFFLYFIVVTFGCWAMCMQPVSLRSLKYYKPASFNFLCLSNGSLKNFETLGTGNLYENLRNLHGTLKQFSR